MTVKEKLNLFNVAIFLFFPSRPHLALEYSGKVSHSFLLLPLTIFILCFIHIVFYIQATKIHQRAFGNDHPITARSLELMATVYAEIGKTEYTGKDGVILK